MVSPGANLPVYIWSSGRVILLDPSSGSQREASGFDSLAGQASSRSAVVLIAHRSSIVRQLAVPALPKSQVTQLVQAKLTPLLPTGLNNFVADFRLTKQAHGEGKLAMVGAIKEDSLRKLLFEAKSAGLSVAATLPAAFGAWLAAHARGLRDGVVVTREGPDLCLDVISEGELKYSRFCSLPDSPDEILDEVERTCSTAGVPMGSILCLGDVQIPVDVPGLEQQPTGLGRYAGNSHTIHTQLFAFELPETAVARDRRKSWMVAQRALLSAILATGLWGYVLYNRNRQEEKVRLANVAHTARLAHETDRQKKAMEEVTQLEKTKHLIDIAFDPAQRFGDLVAVLSADSDDKSWITGISLERGKSMTIRGQAKDGKTVTKLASKLSNENRLRNVKLMSVGKGQEKNAVVVQFAISGFPIGNLPFDEEIGKDGTKDKAVSQEKAKS